jgi:PAS domain S-box-containing protein
MFGNSLAGARQSCILIGLASDLLYSSGKTGRTMESEPLKILFIGGDEQFAHTLAEMLGGANELVTVPTMDAAMPRLSGKHTFQAILIDLPAADKDGLLQVGLLTVKKPKLPILVLGSTGDTAFAAEIIRAGAQDYLAKDGLDAQLLQRTIRCAVERQHERTSLIEEKDNYYGVFDHLVEGIFRTTPDGHYLLANIALANIYGYESPVELMASITDIAHRLYVEPCRREEFVQIMQANDTITGFESKIYRKDETIIWIAENCRAVRDAQGNLLHYEGTVEDISERKHAEEQIRRTTAELSRSREELRAKNQLMEDNLRMAREIQTAMLPQLYPVFPPGAAPAQSAFQFTHRYHPADAVSGDFLSGTPL